MIQPNELRIGNIVCVEKFGIDIPAQIENADEISNSIYYNYKGMELTEYVLLKCGFKKIGKYTFVCESSLMQIEVNYKNGLFIHSILAIEIKYLHQLQNLYFAITGKELNIVGI